MSSTKVYEIYCSWNDYMKLWCATCREIDGFFMERRHYESIITDAWWLVREMLSMAHLPNKDITLSFVGDSRDVAFDKEVQDDLYRTENIDCSSELSANNKSKINIEHRAVIITIKTDPPEPQRKAHLWELPKKHESRRNSNSNLRNLKDDAALEAKSDLKMNDFFSEVMRKMDK